MEGVFEHLVFGMRRKEKARKEKNQLTGLILFLMSRKSYSPEEIELISSCPHIKSVTQKTVRYTAEFMEAFRAEVLDGERGMDVFLGHGLPVDVIGRQSVRQTIRNWNHKLSHGIALTDQIGRPSTRELTKDELIAMQKAKIEMLQQENDFLRQIRRLERRHQPSKSPSPKGSR